MPPVGPATDRTKRVWHHYKGGTYLLITVAETHEHNGDLDAVYFSLTHKKFVTRPFARDSRNQDSWTDVVRWPDGIDRPRFIPGVAPAVDLFIDRMLTTLEKFGAAFVENKE
jgi:hypothetical protein